MSTVKHEKLNDILTIKSVFLQVKCVYLINLVLIRNECVFFFLENMEFERRFDN